MSTDINKLVSSPLSNYDLNDLLKDVNSELGERKQINIYTVPQMLKNPSKFKKDLSKNGYVVMFIENKGSKIGHWTVILENGNRINFFCSYGSHPNDLDTRLDAFLRKHFNDVRYNTFQYQKYSDDIATCGRWVMLVIGLRKIMGDKMSLEDINDVIKLLRKEFGGSSFDKTVTKLINFEL